MTQEEKETKAIESLGVRKHRLHKRVDGVWKQQTSRTKWLDFESDLRACLVARSMCEIPDDEALRLINDFLAAHTGRGGSL